MRKQTKICVCSCLLFYYAFVVPAGLIIFCVTTLKCDYGTLFNTQASRKDAVKIWSTHYLGCFFKNETCDRLTLTNLTLHYNEPRKLRNKKCEFTAFSLLSRLHWLFFQEILSWCNLSLLYTINNTFIELLFVQIFGRPQSHNWDGILNNFFKVEIDEIFLTNKPGLKCVNSRRGTHQEWRIEDGMNNSVAHLEKESSEYPLVNITFFLYETEMFRKFDKHLNNYTFGTYENLDSIIEETYLVLMESSDRYEYAEKFQKSFKVQCWQHAKDKLQPTTDISVLRKHKNYGNRPCVPTFSISRIRVQRRDGPKFQFFIWLDNWWFE